ncbi:MAG: AraC family transcriptional regulator [Rubrivivax sp.]|nr:MAG: AraC family transcriptional regulator [Rubrivivax sp.]
MVLLSSTLDSNVAPPSWRPETATVTPSMPMPGIASWVRAAATCGFELDAAFQAAGVHLDLSQANRPVVSPDALLRALSECVKRSTDHYFPLVLGESYVFDRFPQLDAFLATSPTMRQAIEALPWIRAMQLPWLWGTLEETEDEAALVFTLGPELARRPEASLVIEIVVASVRKFAKGLLGRSLAMFDRPLYAIQFQMPRPENAAMYQDFFPGPVQFGAPRNALVFPRSMLDAPLSGALPALHGQARQAIVHEIESHLPQFASTESVRHVLESQPDLLRVGLDKVAEVLGIHARTLQRRLQAEGFRFADLQAQAKYARARQMLAKKAVSMEAISEELGFSDRRAFTYAFKRWAGSSPSAYRAQLLRSSMAALRR